MKATSYLFISVVSLLFSACTNQAKHPQADLANQSASPAETEKSILHYADSVDAQYASLEKHVSLIYQSGNLSLFVEKLSENGKPALYVEHSSNEGLTDKAVKYYYEKDSLVLVKENIKRTKDQVTVFEEKRIYLRNNIPFSQDHRLATSFSALQNKPFSPLKASGSEDYAEQITVLNDALTGSNKFDMIFDQFITSPEGQYLLLKSKIPGSYTSSIAVKNNDLFIDSLIEYPSIFKDAKLNINWEIKDKEAVYVPVAASVTSASGLKR